MNPVIAFFIDAFRYNYLSKQKTPFLYQLSKEAAICGHVDPILAYSRGIKATIFSSTYPRTHNQWTMFKFDPTASPFNICRPLSFLDALPNSMVKRGLKHFASSFVGKLFVQNRYHEFTTRNMPFIAAKFFDISRQKRITGENALNVPTIFDILRSQGKQFVYLRAKGDMRSKLAQLPEDVELIIIYFDELDLGGHWYGLGRNFVRLLRGLDYKLVRMWNLLKQKYGEFETVIFSDHGMAKVETYMDLSPLVKAKEFGKDFLLFLNSTMIQVWYLSKEEAVKRRVRTLINGTHAGRFLEAHDVANLKIDFPGREYGDDIFLVEPPKVIFPNFISIIKPKAMHGYHPQYEDQKGIFLYEGSLTRGAKEVQLVDIAPTLLTLLKLKQAIPRKWEGKSVVTD